MDKIKGFQIDLESLSGVESAKKLKTARNITLSGDISGITEFDGSNDINIVTTLEKEIPKQIQSDWNQIDDTKVDFIKNKPSIATEEDVINLLIRLELITPALVNENTVYTNNEGKIYSL